MNFKKFSVLEDLFELSKKADEIISKSFDDFAPYDNFFEKAKLTILQILDGSYLPKGNLKSPAIKRDASLKPGLKNSIPPLSEYRVRLHAKNKDQEYEALVENSSRNASLSSDTKSKISGDSHTSTSNVTNDAPTKAEAQNQYSEGKMETDMVIEVDPTWKASPEVSLSSNSIKDKNSPASGASKVTPPQLTPDLKVKWYAGGRTYVCKKFKKISVINDKNISNGKSIPHTSPNVRDAEPVNDSENVPNKGSVDKTYTISSDSSKENISCKISEEIFKTPSNFPTCYSSMHEQDIINRCLNKRKRRTRTRIPLGIRNAGENSSEDDCQFMVHKHKKLKESEISSISKISSKVDENEHKSSNRLRSLKKKSTELSKTKDALGITELTNLNQKSTHSSGDHRSTNPGFPRNRILKGLKNSQNETNKGRCRLMCEKLGKRKFSHKDQSRSTQVWESGSKGSEPETKKGKCNVVNEDIKAERWRKFLGDKKKTHEKSQTQSQTKSVPFDFIQKLRPGTPVECVENCNRQSLKVKAEERRRQREIRVQKTKERRELLEKEKEERIRLSEQRWKQRFQQHEEMLKQKAEKFKIKSQNRQQSNTRRNLQSTSSKDSKEDRAEDNDDFCRNGGDSGQKLSKESNGYHDASLKKVGLTSLEGNAGIIPDIPKRHNAILVGCEKTPVEFTISCNGTELKEAENVPLSSRDDGGLKVFKESHSEPFGKHDSTTQGDKHVDTISSDSESKVSSNDRNLCNSSKTDNFKLTDNLTRTPLKTPKTKKIDRMEFLNEVFNKSASEEKRNTYFLRSAQKINPNKTVEYSASNSPLVDVPQNQPKNEKVFRKFYCPSSVEREKSKYENLCFKCSKNQKLRQNMKTDYKKKSRQEDKSSKQTTKVKDSAKYSNKETTKKTPNKTPGTVRKIPKVTSYKISDIHDNSFSEVSIEPRKMPLWATGLYLKQTLIHQHYKPPNVEKIFGLPKYPIDLVDIFGRDKPEYHKRTSSEHWVIGSTPTTHSSACERKYKYIN